MWLALNVKDSDEIYVNSTQIVWCSFLTYYNEDWQREVIEMCEICLPDGKVIKVDGPVESLEKLIKHVSGSTEKFC